MNEHNIVINGASDILNLNTDEAIIMNWSKLEQEQISFNIKIFDEFGTIVFNTPTLTSNQTFFQICIPHSIERCKYKIILKITSLTNENLIYEKIIYSNNGNLKNANWITRLDNPIEKEYEYFKNKPNIILEKEFTFNEINTKVFLDICGLGYYTVKINDKQIDESFLNSDVSNYSKTIYFDTYCVDKFLKQGINKISVELANGWYHPAPIKLLGKYNVRSRLTIGKPCLICQLSYKNKRNELTTINSDESWQSKKGNYLFNNLFIGERVASSLDLIKDQGDVREQTVKIAGPGGLLKPSRIRKIKRKKKFLPQKVQSVKQGLIIDFGRIISGHFACKFNKNIQGKIKVFYSEAITENNEMDYKSSISGAYGYTLSEMGINEKDPVIQFDEIIKGDDNFYFENKYVYHSFRFVYLESSQLKIDEVTDICAYSVYTDLEYASHFESSNEKLNLLWSAARNTKLNNIHSYFEDCPRERLGYGGDIVALIDSQIYSFDIEQLLLKVLTDFINDQTSEGGIPQTAPYIGIQTNGPSDRAGSLGWQLVFPTLIKKIKQHYFQPNLIENHKEKLVNHINYLLMFDYDYIKHCCLADWGSIDTDFMSTPDRAFCSAMMYYLLLATYSELLADDEIVELINDKLKNVHVKIMNEFYHEKGYFQSGTQSSYAFSLFSNILDEEKKGLVLTNFIKQIEKDKGVLRSGIFGIPWTYKILSEVGRDDLIYSWLNREDKPSFLDMLSKGGEVLREHFDESHGSYNHAMFTSYPTWLVEKILGIQVESYSYGASHVKIAPYFPDDMEFARGDINTIRGRVTSEWERTGNEIKMLFKIPKTILFHWEIPGNYQLVNHKQIDIGFYTQLELNILRI